MVKGSEQLGIAIQGAFDGINNPNNEEKNNSRNKELKNSRNVEINNSTLEKDEKVKTGYRLYKSALNKLEEMQMFMYPRTESGKKVSIETIINDAINHWYEVKKNEGK